MIKFLIVVIFILVLAGSVGYIVTQQNSIAQIAPTPNQTKAAPTPTVIIDESIDLSKNTYEDPKGTFKVKYPTEYKIDSQNNGQYIRFSKVGETQTGQTEMFDGVIIVFESVNLGDKTLSSWIDGRIKESTADGTMKVVAIKEPTTIGKYSGYTYALQGLGTSDYFVIQKDASSKNAVVITNLIEDPQNKNYQAEVDTIFSHIELLK